ncbi:Gfo/Idh/MocA family protein [Paenibacillus pinistramenti]|uniref:Gfo/Idh/MocA family protein n=1 Tax=Paenibacillus pinistramenti TaxID=1768003 RepID=UPI0011097517|nr:Gfo/Idh/MocA family oxidoreductase [Paenibacillus pinistramenti]
MEQRKVRWGILSTGWIAEQFVKDLAHVSNGECVAVGSRTKESASAFAQKHGIPRAYGSYEELAQDPDVDVIYIGTPHPYHKENTLTCLRAGKAVLCEKPFTINSGELQEMADLAREKGLFLMEAMWTRFLPPIRKVREWIAEGRIGDVKLVRAEFGFKTDWNPQHRLLDLKLGGGALLDAGIYPVSFASMVLGPSPEQVHSTAHIGETGVDEHFSILLDYGGGKSALLSGAVRVDMPNEAIIYGSEGYIRIPSFLNSKEAVLYVNGEEAEKFEDNRESLGYNFEAEAVGEYLLAGKQDSSVISLDESLKLMQLLDQIRGQWGIKYPGESFLTS